MKYLIIVAIIFSLPLSAQPTDSLNVSTEPQGGVSRLAMHYFKLNFTKEQRALLSQEPIELIFFVDANGKPALEKVNTITDAVILDSLQRATASVPLFRPERVDGKDVSSVYFLSIRFPQYGQRQPHVPYRYFNSTNLDDYEEIEFGNTLDWLVGGVFNAFSGNAAQYLRPGGGFKIDMTLHGKKRIGVGLSMTAYGNRLKMSYPIASTREQIKAPPTLAVGLLVAYRLATPDKRCLTLQAEPNFVSQNVTERLDNYDKGWTQFKGFSLGLSAHYMIRLGKERASMYYLNQTVNSHWINFHMALRSMVYDNNAANGLMLEAGVSYRMKSRIIRSYRLKQ